MKSFSSPLFIFRSLFLLQISLTSPSSAQSTGSRLRPHKRGDDDGLIGDRPHWKVGQAVGTSSGNIIGHAAPNVTKVSEYLGIPYAKPPVGNLRFAPPQRYKGKGDFVASKFSPDCPANTADPALIDALTPLLYGPQSVRLLKELGQAGQAQSEDCLTLNIWTKPQVGDKAKAVLLWIYGGGFATGSSNNPAYIGQYFAENQDVVVVTFNYRVNVFGFPGVPGVQDVAQNAGLMDQRLAVEWVRDNIENFGGDPDRITLFGQSAGGGSVDYYTYAYVNDPIVNAFIPQSGTVTSFGNPPPQNNTAAWYNATSALGCGNPGTPLAETITCVRTKPYQAVLNAIKVADPLAAVLGQFGPTSDNKVVFSDYGTRAARGEFIQRPYLVGNNNYEAGLFKILGITSNITNQEWCLFNAAVFTCPAAKAAEYRRRQEVNTWRYRYYGDFSNLRLSQNPPLGPSGAWHGAEIPVIWGTEVDASGVGDERGEGQVSRYLQGLWADFAKDPENALYGDKYNLPDYRGDGKSLIEFAVNGELVRTVYPNTTDSLCPLLEEIGRQFPGGIGGLLTSGGKIPPGLIPDTPLLCSPTS
ncbi:alpha/beta-hydrolase [Tothia fuscella]|uniref:Carboxylic ester hydrolase n=1 Tax=Tothia fuscella TaxID=1048955 RepID=A0A9P4U273_9PEZI|nr:alpha/beta-hydrolase [Tothia fuscella]